jgi:hypothetical protein
MISAYGNLFLQSIVSRLREIWNSLENFFGIFWDIILIVAGIIILYLVVTRVFLRGTTYKTARKESTCVLTMPGRERSLEYLERFGGIKGVEAQAIRYLRKHGPIPKKNLEKTFGSNVIKALLEDGFIKIT